MSNENVKTEKSCKECIFDMAWIDGRCCPIWYMQICDEKSMKYFKPKSENNDLAEVLKMKIHGLFLDERLTKVEKDNLYSECIGCLNRICITDDKEEVLTMLASLQVKAMILGKNTFLRIDEKSELD